MSQEQTTHDFFTSLREIRDGVDRFLEEGVAALRNSEAMPIDIYETGHAVIIKANIAGAEAESIDVTIENGALVIQGKTHSDAVEGATKVRQERRFGRFYRAVPLYVPVDADETTAEYKDGVLTVTLPKTEEVRAKSVKIK